MCAPAPAAAARGLGEAQPAALAQAHRRGAGSARGVAAAPRPARPGLPVRVPVTWQPARGGAGARRGPTVACLGFPASPGLAEERMELEGLVDAFRLDHNRPTFHVAPRSGWMNDPNGPFYHNGEYHLFYQHIVNGCEWDFGIVWGHAVSRDLVHWEHLAHALLPTPGGTDADGCFSGCTAVDCDGTPTILYTGVRLRSNPECGPLPPQECDLQLPFIETQLVATADAGDASLETWHKQAEPMIAVPPPNMGLVGWRDPYIFETKSPREGRPEWGMLLGSGIRGRGGAVMIYRSEELRGGWRYDGLLCEAEDLDTGAMWECPLLIELNRQPEPAPGGRLRPLRASMRGLSNIQPFALDGDCKAHAGADGNGCAEPSANGAVRPAGPPPHEEVSTSGNGSGGGGGGGYTHFLCISPDAPTNPVKYWLGNFDAEACRFLLESAKGPLNLDLGDILYAPNLMVDKQGRHILWGWLQERRKMGSYDYAGCLSLPRLVSLRGERLIQEPVPELAQLRSGPGWQAKDLRLFPEEPLPLGGVAGPALDIQVTIERGSASAAGVLIRSWNAGEDGGAAIVYDWQSGRLEAAFQGDADGAAVLADLDASFEGPRRFGGDVSLLPGEPLKMRVLLDGSCVEVYLATGEVLSTRIYRGEAPPGADAGIDLVAWGGPARVPAVHAWEMRSIWRGPPDGSEAGSEPGLDAAGVMGAPVPL